MSGIFDFSGSNDGTARIWRFEKHQWKATVLNMAAKLESPTASSSISTQSGATDQLRVTMVSWSVDDQKVMTAASDRTIKVWWALTGVLLQVLEVSCFLCYVWAFLREYCFI